jgi:hypothetical protein
VHERIGKRLLLSAVGGPVITLLYAVLLLLIFSLLRGLRVTYHPYFEYFGLPVTWPGNIYAHFFGYKDNPAYNWLRGDVWLACLIGDFVLYAMLTYILLRYRSERIACLSHTN